MCTEKCNVRKKNKATNSNISSNSTIHGRKWTPQFLKLHKKVYFNYLKVNELIFSGHPLGGLLMSPWRIEEGSRSARGSRGPTRTWVLWASLSLHLVRDTHISIAYSIPAKHILQSSKLSKFNLDYFYDLSLLELSLLNLLSLSLLLIIFSFYCTF